MNRAVSTLTAASAGVGLAVASTSAKAFVPIVLAAIIGGAAVGGAALGGAATNTYNYPYGYYPYSYPTVATTAPMAVTPAPTVVAGPSVTVNRTTCHFTHRWIDGIRHRVRVCDTIAP